MGSLFGKCCERPTDTGKTIDLTDSLAMSNPDQTERGLPPVPLNGICDILIVRALYDFDAITDEDLSFKKGDRMKVEDDLQSNDWWVAYHLVKKISGYIPSNYVTKDDNSIQAQDWWHDLERKDAEIQLLLPGNITGTYLVRLASDRKSYVLSVRDYDEKLHLPMVKHYRLRTIDNGGYYITPKHLFSDLFELLDHYRSFSEGLCQRLIRVCPKERPVVHFRELEINREAVVLIKKLDSGCFGDVYLGKWNNSVNVAIKTLKAGTMSCDDFVEEARTMHMLRHRRLVQLLAVCTREEPIYIITELMDKGSLLNYLRDNKSSTDRLKVQDLIEIAAQVSDGMKYLENCKYVHRDLRAANILVAANKTVKVADFGLARLIKDEVYEGQGRVRFPVKWTAPEAAFQHRFSTKSDVWSYGVLLYEIITFGRVPYPEYPGRTVLLNIEKGYRMPKPTEPVGCPDAYYEVMLQCWNKKPEMRPTFEYLFSYFNDFLVASEHSYLE
ncbi:tyrosine-protein kinase SRK2 isoform X1 [Octopus sinensis]|uniref:Tyrosine-protein kinase n=1 Tax=Octopus sinensis TaxID=2607531 RepID=A0A6P7TLF0_9MOLL|nr:tyrosine-protein kinase SRK2 isoform X1 [Octopus sinensis]